ncbi:MAG: hypothetical protein AB7I50_04330 [Vicinamibacterales bacterium]
MRTARPHTQAAVAGAAFFSCWVPTVEAIDKDKAVYIGGTLTGFPPGGRTAHMGRVDTRAESQFVFDAGSKGAITIPYGAIVSLTFGRNTPFGRYEAREQRGARVFPEDFYTKSHCLLTIVYQDQSDTDQVVVLWLGDEIVRPTLATLEGRSGIAIRFADAQGCAQYRTPEECGYAAKGALKGTTRVFVDTGDIAGREFIVLEIQKAKLGMQVSDEAEDADVILNFRASRNFTGAHVGIGEIFVRQDRLRLVSEFVESGRSEKAVTAKFAETFVEAYKKDNQR